MASIEVLTERIDRNSKQISEIVHYMCGMRTHHELGACALNAAQKAQGNMIRCTEQLRLHGFFTMEELAETTPYHYELEMA
jgi:hypothetical protein